MIPQHDKKIQFSLFSEKIGVITKSLGGSPSENVLCSSENGKYFKYSDNGRYLVVCEPQRVLVYDCASLTEALVLQETAVSQAYFSPLGSFLVTWQRPDKGGVEDNLKVWSVTGGKQLVGWRQRHQLSWPTVQWTSDELVAGVLLQIGKISFFTGSNFSTSIQQITAVGLISFTIAPGKSPYKVATFIPVKGSSPGFVSIYTYPNVNKPVINKNFFADSVDISWNSNGSALLLTTNQDVDKTGKSYYGKKGLYFIQTMGGNFDSRVTDKSIHDVKWNPNGNEFAVIYGDMPDPKISLFDLKCQKTADLAEPGEARNALFYDPKGRILCVGGFGSLKGNLDFYDITSPQIRKVGSANAFSSGYHEWCPDSQHFLTAVVAPRMRIDNGIKVLDYNGNVVYEEALLELFDVKWRPIPPETFPAQPINSVKELSKSKVAVAPAPAAPKVYRHPHFSGSTQAETQSQGVKSAPTRYVPGAGSGRPVGGTPIGGTPVGGTPVGGTPVGGEPESAGRGRGKKKNPNPQAQGGAGGGGRGRGQNPPDAEKGPLSPEQEKEKRRKNIIKKLKEIETLKQRQANGETLNPAQLTKISSQAELQNELNQFN